MRDASEWVPRWPGDKNGDSSIRSFDTIEKAKEAVTNMSKMTSSDPSVIVFDTKRGDVYTMSKDDEDEEAKRTGRAPDPSDYQNHENFSVGSSYRDWDVDDDGGIPEGDEEMERCHKYIEKLQKKYPYAEFESMG
jgi:hypothetical protein